MTPTIRARRDALGLTQKTAAQVAGVTETTWQRFETDCKKIAPYLATRCMRLLNGEIKIPKGTPRKRSPAECAALAENPQRRTSNHDHLERVHIRGRSLPAERSQWAQVQPHARA